MLWRIFNLVIQFKDFDFLFYLSPFLQEFLSLFVTRVDRSPFKCILEPLNAPLFQEKLSNI
jgi:hypothetical protein